MPLANLKFLRADRWLENIFDFTATYHRDIRFFESRYEERHSILMCSIPFVFIGVASLVTLLFRYNKDDKQLKKYYLKVHLIHDMTYPRVILNLVLVFYLPLLISAMINVATLYSNTVGDVISSIWTVFSLVVLILLPFQVQKLLLADKAGSYKLLKVSKYKT